MTLASLRTRSQISFRKIATDPLRGDIIKGTGGARKRRFPGRGRGKSGGYRTVAYFAGEDVPVALLALIDKGARANISDADANALRKELAGYAEDYRRGVQRRVQELKREETVKKKLPLGKRLIQAAKEVRAIARGEADQSTYRVYVPSDVDVRKIRRQLGLTQGEFASRFGLSVATIREWEQERRRPEGAARVLLTVIEKEPAAVMRALAAGAA